MQTRKGPVRFLVEYVDGLEAAVSMSGDGYVRNFAYAQQRGASTDSIEYHIAGGPARAAFGYLGLNIEDFFVSGTAPNPVERTLLTTGILEAAMISRSRGGTRVQTPHLSTIRYQPGKGARRPAGTRPKGASVGDWIVHEPGATPAAEPIPISRDGTVRRPRPTN